MDQLLQEIRTEAEREGPAAVRQLESMHEHFARESWRLTLERAERLGRVLNFAESYSVDHRRALALFFGLGGLNEHTLQETGDELGITRERTRMLIHELQRDMNDSLLDDLRRSIPADSRKQVGSKAPA